MDNWTIALLIFWIILAIANIVGIWVPLPVCNATFGFMNLTIIVSLVPFLYKEIKRKRAEKKEKKLKK